MVSQTIHDLIQNLSISEMTSVNKEAVQMSIKSGISVEAAQKLVYENAHPVSISLKTDNTSLEQKLDKILDKIDRSEDNIKTLLQNKTNFYVNNGYSEDEAIKMAKAELVFDSPDVSKLQFNISAKQTAKKTDLDDAVDLLSKL